MQSEIIVIPGYFVAFSFFFLLFLLMVSSLNGEVNYKFNAQGQSTSVPQASFIRLQTLFATEAVF